VYLIAPPSLAAELFLKIEFSNLVSKSKCFSFVNYT